ncbi:hypothetical protein SAMN04488077_12213 [Roseovarius tolerans]|uniref:Uncharacterized protein n=1 Tax=Roseovarius tolerans TaxID=74031 RepID=A0A1H8I0M8_9RHOB|nr:hypothetical protein [Roseovarius tolerans]SEN62053.1 hypothetical protein SAMN04488077_12213 [Roseovarius tolerans]
MRRSIKITISALATVIGIGIINAVRVDNAVSEASEYQDDISAHAYYQFGVVPDSIVFDIWNVGWNASQAEVLGVFLRFSEKMKDREFREVRLAYRGEAKFVLDGDDFQDIGQQFSYQNPVYIVRTFPEKLRTPDGGRAFSTWSGGLLGVVGRQMEDVNELGERWYLDDMR